MQETQEGIVLENIGDFAKIQVLANPECENCGGCNTSGITVTAYNKINAVPGNKVRMTLSQNSMLKISFMLFLFPLMSIFSGLYVGKITAAHFQFNQTLSISIGAVLFLLLSVLIISIYDKKFKLNKSNFSTIIEVID